MKAKFIGKHTDTSFGQFIVYLEYEYRGHRYTVYENRCKGNEPLAWQHRSQQDWIDRIIESEKPKSDSQPVDALEEIFALLDEVFEA